jgi:hypothetical protein
MQNFKRHLALLGLFPVLAPAMTYDIPYTGGKLSGSVVISGSVSSMSRDTVQLGAARIYLGIGAKLMLTVCGFKPPTMVQFVAPFGSVAQSVDTSSDWNDFTAYPDSVTSVPPVTTWSGGGSDSLVAPGFELFRAGQNNSCAGEEYFKASGWNRVVFLRFGSGVDYRAKLSFQEMNDTVYVGPPTNTTYQILRSLRLYYVVNANSTDLAGPVALRPDRPGRAAPRLRAGAVTDLYNPLGIRLRREARAHEVVIPLRR